MVLTPPLDIGRNYPLFTTTAYESHLLQNKELI
jgi:hypothetical protein